MALTIEQMRKYVRNAYNTWTWHEKVKNMSDAQVYALYCKFNKEGRFDPKYRKAVNHPKPQTQFEQITLFDIGLTK